MSDRPPTWNIGAMTPLEKFVAARLAELGDERGPLSYRAAADKAEGLISFQLLHLMATGQGPGRHSDRTLRGIALALDVPQAKIIELAGQAPRETEFRLPKKANKLTEKDRKAVEALVNALLDAHERAEGV